MKLPIKILIGTLLATSGVTAGAEVTRDVYRPGAGIHDNIGRRPGRRPGRNIQRAKLVMNDHFRGNNIIHLKQEIRQQTGLSPRNFQLKQVMILGKSKRGNGMVNLLVDGFRQDSNYLSARGNFQSDRLQTFSRIGLNNNSRSQGKWQLELTGNIKIKNIVVLMQPKRHAPPARPMKIVIPMHSSTRGAHTIHLKQQIKQNGPLGMKLSKFKLTQVKLVAKSKQGRGQVELEVGRTIQDRATINGNPWDFDSRGGFDKVLLTPMGRQQNGSWQLHLRGKIKIKKIVVMLTPKRGGRGNHNGDDFSGGDFGGGFDDDFGMN